MGSSSPVASTDFRHTIYEHKVIGVDLQHPKLAMTKGSLGSKAEVQRRSNQGRLSISARPD